MRALTVGELTRMRGSSDALLPSTCTRLRTAYTSNGAGGFTSTDSEITYSCRVAPGAPYNYPMEPRVAEKLENTSIWTLILPYDADVTIKDVMQVSGENYQVVGVHDNKDWQTALRVICSKVL